MILPTQQLKWLGFFSALLLLIVCSLASILLGLKHYSVTEVIQAYTQFNGSNEHLIIRNARVPRMLIALAVGGSLALAGCLMQALTRNPLASPEMFGINSGASFFIVMAVAAGANVSMAGLSWIAFGGAAIAALAIFVLGSSGHGGLTPMKLTLAGAALMALFSSMTHGMLILNEKALEEVLFWLAGSVEGRGLNLLYSVLPYMMLGWFISILLSKPLNVYSLGEDAAKGVGMNTLLVKLSAWTAVVLLAGSSVAVAGPIGFLGIMVPYAARSIVGPDYRWMIPYSIVLGASLLLIADVASRYVIRPEEVPVGVMTAVMGVPIFVHLARRGLKES